MEEINWLKVSIGVLVAIVTGGISLFLKWLYDTKVEAEKKLTLEEEKRKAELSLIINEIRDSDKKQTERIDNISKDIESLSKDMEELKKHLKLDDKKQELKRLLKKEAAKIVEFNPGLSNPHFSGMITLLSEGRDATINLGIDMLFSDTDDVTKESIANDVWTIFDRLKIIANSHISSTFAKELRNNTNIRIYGESLIYNLYEIKQGTFNGSLFKQLNQALIRFMTDVSTEAIRYWRESNLKKEFVN